MSSPLQRLSIRPSSPILSPSKAARDASVARDWSYVSGWLSRKYHPHPVPRFERNDETLQALLAMVAANVAADERAELLQKAQEEEMIQWTEAQANRERNMGLKVVDNLLDMVNDNLDAISSESLDSFAESSVLLGTTSTSPSMLSTAIIDLTSQEFEVRSQISRVESLRLRLEKETKTLQTQVSDLKEQHQHTIEEQEHMQQQIADWNRASKLLDVKFGEYRDRVAALDRAEPRVLTIESLREKEKAVMRQRDQVRVLEKELQDYQGLPPDLEAAKEEYQRLEGSVAKLRRRRDQLFENMANG